MSFTISQPRNVDTSYVKVVKSRGGRGLLELGGKCLFRNEKHFKTSQDEVNSVIISVKISLDKVWVFQKGFQN
jgi:hypothetical protein